jgi:hypothetical protein
LVAGAIGLIPDEDPWARDDVIVAEVKSFDERPHAGHRRTYAALVPTEQIETVKGALAKLHHEVSASDPWPSYQDDRAFTPCFWVGTSGSLTERYEPLILVWMSHDKTVLQPDPGFLMTYGLSPRAINQETVYWDDPKAPRQEIVTVTTPSVWDFPLGTHAYVSISRDYLQDYLTLRHMALVQIYWEMRWGQIDAEIEGRLGGREAVEIEFSDRRLSLRRAIGDKARFSAQVWGARLLAVPGALPITSDPLDDDGLVWPGVEKAINNEVARGLGAADYVYVDDTVLSTYEGRPEFRLHPESGSVMFGTQWSVGYCDRIGRNTIRLETKKLYEGAPAAVVRHWHKFAVRRPHVSRF